MYFKLKNDHLGLYSGTPSRPGYTAAGRRARAIHADIHRNNLSFSEYFRKYVRFIYDGPTSIHRSRYDQIYRFETMSGDIDHFLSRIGHSSSRPNASNKTEGRTADYLEYYDRPAQKHARIVFSPFMNDNDYEFPSDWHLFRGPSSIQLAQGRFVSKAKFMMHALRNKHNRTHL